MICLNIWCVGMCRRGEREGEGGGGGNGKGGRWRWETVGY